jgi:hypothetical protein
VDLLQDAGIAVVHERIRRPERQTGIHAASVEFRASGTV